MKKFKIEVDEKVLQHIAGALELYGRLQLGQLEKITSVPTIQQAIMSSKDVTFSDIELYLTEAKKVIWPKLISSGVSFSVFNNDMVSDSVREVFHIQHQIRHELWKASDTDGIYSTDSRPSDICNIAGIPAPNLKFIDMFSIEVISVHSEATIPSYQTEGASGFDFHAVEEATIKPGESKLIPTGLIFQIPTGYELQVRPRSGLAAKHNLTVLNTPGTVDSKKH